MLRAPVRYDKTLLRLEQKFCLGLGDKYLETKLRLQETIQNFAVGTCVRIVDALIRAHNGTGSSFHSVLERPGLVSLEGKLRSEKSPSTHQR